MPPFNTELFHILSQLCFYSEWQGTFPLGKLEKCFYFFFFFFFLSLPFQLASIFHPKHQAGGGSSAGRGQRSAGIIGRHFSGQRGRMRGHLGGTHAPHPKWAMGKLGPLPAEVWGGDGATWSRCPVKPRASDRRGITGSALLSKHRGEVSPHKKPPRDDKTR